MNSTPKKQTNDAISPPTQKSNPASGPSPQEPAAP